MAQSTSLRKPTRPQEANAKKMRRLASLGMTGVGLLIKDQLF
jgi:hypothetical protein